MSEAAEAEQKPADEPKAAKAAEAKSAAGPANGPTDEKDAELGGAMTLLEHLAELRIRLFYSALALLIGFSPA